MGEMNATANSEPQELAEPQEGAEPQEFAEPQEVAEPQHVAEPQAASAEPEESTREGGHRDHPRSAVSPW